MPRSRSRLAVLFAFLLAIACIAIAHERNQGRRRAAEEEESAMLPPVVPLPAKRKRALTPSPTASGVASQRQPRTRSQWRSPLFAKLPLEIRTMVYEQALGCNDLHIVGRVHTVMKSVRRGRGRDSPDVQEPQTSFQLSHVKCIGRCERVCRYEGSEDVRCWECFGIEDDRKRRRRSTRGSQIAFLQSCRRIYAEAIAILYRCNTFDFHCMDNLLPFSTTILPQRFNNIRSLRLHRFFGFELLNLYQFGPPNRVLTYLAGEEWPAIWSLVASMQGLRDLDVHLLARSEQRRRLSLEDETQVFEPLMLVKQAKRSVIHVSWLRPQPAFEREDMPFQIVCDAEHKAWRV